MDLAALAAECGIVTEYLDARGQHRRVSDEALRLVLGALTGRDAAAGGHQIPRRLAPMVVREGDGRALELDTHAHGRWAISTSTEEIARGTLTDGRLHLPEDLTPGRYRCELTAQSDAGSTSRDGTALLVAPRTSYQLDHLPGRRVWVLAVQLYAVRSRRNWGHGDFTDLKELLRIAAESGAAGVGLNPLHALFDDRPEDASPYSPNSRLFLNPLYIDIEAVPEFSAGAHRELETDLHIARAADIVDYTRVARVKMACLRAMHATFRSKRNAKRRKQFATFRAERGDALTRFAAFETLRRRHANVWWEWDDPWREGGADALARLRKDAGQELEFYEYVQWVADSQLAECRAEGQRLGLGIGLYIDLAVGVDPGGADAWADQNSVMKKVEVGAPPDLLNTAGQAWGLAAFNPRALEECNFQPFADLLAAAMRYAGAIRLDHVLGLYRLWLIPFGLGAANGAYVLFPLQALLATIAIESTRHKCLVIGEDLGTVPGDLRTTLSDWGIWSYQVMLFERWDDGSFKQPQDYKADALITFSTHDLPTFTGWMSGHDLRVKWGLGMDPGESGEARDDARHRLQHVLREQNIGDGRVVMEDVIRFLARAPSRLLVVEMDDVLELEDQPNVPGTMLEHPNWRRRLPLALEDFRLHDGLARLRDVLEQEGRSQRNSRD
jgi:4-alpha-glucanotransferase